MRLLNPWFVATGTRLIAARPIGARELKRTERTGRTLAEQLAKPSGVNVLAVESK